jgi:hypothetical protein
MSDIWESVWESVSEAYRRLSASLTSIYPGMKWSCGHGANKVFPFRAYGTFNRGAEGSEDIIASVDFHRPSGEELSYSADIGLDDGQVLADGPSGIISVINGLAAATPEIEAAVREVVAFLDSGTQVISAAMEGEQQ